MRQGAVNLWQEIVFVALCKLWLFSPLIMSICSLTILFDFALFEADKRALRISAICRVFVGVTARTAFCYNSKWKSKFEVFLRHILNENRGRMHLSTCFICLRVNLCTFRSLFTIHQVLDKAKVCLILSAG